MNYCKDCKSYKRVCNSLTHGICDGADFTKRLDTCENFEKAYRRDRSCADCEFVKDAPIGSDNINEWPLRCTCPVPSCVSSCLPSFCITTIYAKTCELYTPKE